MVSSNRNFKVKSFMKKMLIDFKPFYCVLNLNKLGFRSTQIVFRELVLHAVFRFFEAKLLESNFRWILMFQFFDFCCCSRVYPALRSHLRGFTSQIHATSTQSDDGRELFEFQMTSARDKEKRQRAKIKARTINVVKLHHQNWHQSSHGWEARQIICEK